MTSHHHLEQKLRMCGCISPCRAALMWKWGTLLSPLAERRKEAKSVNTGKNTQEVLGTTCCLLSFIFWGTDPLLRGDFLNISS
jgi:hypothetical protein